MSLPLQMFTYLFRPLPIEAHSITALAASIDNMALLFLVIMLITTKVRIFKSKKDTVILLSYVYVLTVWVVLSLTTANLGIAMRQKWMFVPLVIYICFYLINSKKRSEISKIKLINTLK